MEEMKEKADSSATSADATEGGGGKKRFALPLPARPAWLEAMEAEQRMETMA